MKKQVLLVLLLIFALLLCGCNEQGQQAENPEQNGSVCQTPENNDPAPSGDDGVQKDPVLAEFDELFGNPESIYRIALYGQYASVDRLPIPELFYYGLPDEPPITDEEFKYITFQSPAAQRSEIVRLPLEKADAILKPLFGTSLLRLQTHSIYGPRDVSVNNFYILAGKPTVIENYRTVAVEEQEDGSLAVTYTIGPENTAYVVTVVPDEKDGYHVVSNLAAEPTPSSRGHVIIYDGPQSWMGFEPDLSECIQDAIYYVDYYTEEVFLISEDPARELMQSDTHVFYITESEPNKLYVVSKEDYTQPAFVYESDSGEITCAGPGPESFWNEIVQFVENEKQFVCLDLTTGEATVLMEQHYIDVAYFDESLPTAESWKDYNRVYFWGQPNEGDQIRSYWYLIDEDEIREYEPEEPDFVCTGETKGSP